MVHRKDEIKETGLSERSSS